MQIYPRFKSYRQDITQVTMFNNHHAQIIIIYNTKGEIITLTTPAAGYG